MEILSSSFWHARFVQQAQWTQALRRHLYGRVNLSNAHRVLEVGCGTGAVLTELTMQSRGEIYGIDLSTNHLKLAMQNLPGIPLALCDAHDLPFPSEVFDITLCHFLILWVSDPVKVLREMVRVTHSGGNVLALAEPDYGGRIDFPSELSILGKWQQDTLNLQGADPLVGRRLRSFLHQVGLVNIEAGVLGGQWSGNPTHDDWEVEWKVLEDDVQQIPGIVDAAEFKRLRKLDQSAWERCERILFVPTFYAWGQVPHSQRI